MEERPLRVGDRVEWTGPSQGPLGAGPLHGERGWLIMVDPADDIIMFGCTEVGEGRNASLAVTIHTSL